MSLFFWNQLHEHHRRDEYHAYQEHISEHLPSDFNSEEYIECKNEQLQSSREEHPDSKSSREC